MNRIDFITEKGEPRLLAYDPINNGNIKIFVNDRAMRYVKTMRIHADLSYGHIRASLTILPRTIGDGNMVDTDSREEINPDMENSLILERIVDDGKFTSFYLRTIITV